MRYGKKVFLKIFVMMIITATMMLFQPSVVFANSIVETKQNTDTVILMNVGEDEGIPDFNGQVSQEALRKAKIVYTPAVKYITAIFTPTAVLAVSFCLAGMMFGFNGKGAETYYSWMKKIFSVWLVFGCLKAVTDLLFSIALNAA